LPGATAVGAKYSSQSQTPLAGGTRSAVAANPARGLDGKAAVGRAPVDGSIPVSTAINVVN